MVDVVDSKSTAGDSVPVRVRSPAPNIPQPPRGRGIFLCQMRLDSNQFNAARMSAAREGWTERILYLRPFPGEDVNRVRSPAPNIPQPPRGRGIFLCQMRLDSNQFNAAGPSAHDRRLHAVYIIYNIVYPTEMDPWELMAVFGDSVGAIHESPAPPAFLVILSKGA